MTETEDSCHLPGYSLGQKVVQQTLPLRQLGPRVPEPDWHTLPFDESGVDMALLGRLPLGETKMLSYIGHPKLILFLL